MRHYFYQASTFTINAIRSVGDSSALHGKTPAVMEPTNPEKSHLAYEILVAFFPLLSNHMKPNASIQKKQSSKLLSAATSQAHPLVSKIKMSSHRGKQATCCMLKLLQLMMNLERELRRKRSLS